MKSKLTLVVAVLVLGACQSLPEKQPVTDSPIQLGAGEWRTTDTLLVVTDASLSTYQNETFPDAQALTRAYVASLPTASAKAERQGPYRVGTTSFGGRRRQGAPIAPYDARALGEAMADLDIIGEQTPLHAVFEDAAAVIGSLDNPGRVAVIVFTDGVPSNERLALDAGKQLVGSAPGGVCIHAVQVGNDPQGTEFVKSLAELSGCSSSRNASSLQTARALESFTRTTMVGKAPLPPVAAPPPPRKIVLRGVNFDFDKSEIRPEDEAVLDAAIEALKETPRARVRISGYTDSIGTMEYNEALSIRRANTVKDFLVNAGIDADRLEPAGYGLTKPVASNDTGDGRAQNRRVEFEVGQ
jgi:OOP family OmpA-OmpF porin